VIFIVPLKWLDANGKDHYTLMSIIIKALTF